MAKKDEPFSKGIVEDLFGGSDHTPQEDQVLEYVIHRIKSGAHLEDVVEEDYVRQNCTQAQIDEIENDPRLVRAARESMEQTFSSDELDPGSNA